MDFGAKQDVIESIGSEVKGLHPLLLSFLDKLENIKRVEYTHGPNEKGADFVLTRFDPALSNFSHVGVVAKVGKIQQDISELERQIDECSLKRKVNGGKEDVRLSEIWVINTSSISNNAKDKIHDKFSRQRIEFIDGQQLTRLVDQHASFFWHQIPSAVGRYLQKLNERISHLERELNVLGDLGCEDFFVEPDIQEMEVAKYLISRHPRPPRYVNLEETVTKEQVTVLEAEMGFGKSKAVRVLAQKYCAEDQFKHAHILPIFLPYRFYAEKYAGIEAALRDQLGDLYEEAIEEEYRLLIILDGIDEATSLPDWQGHIRRTIRDAKSLANVRLVLTSRPLHVLDESLSLYEGTKRLMLRPLSLKKLVQFVEKACEKHSIPKKLFEDLAQSDLFKQLPQSPIAAALLSRLLTQNQQDLPANLTELYSKSLDLMLGRWDVQKKNVPEREYLAVQRATLRVAEYMVGNRLIWMSLKEAQQIVHDWHSKRNLGVSSDVLLQRMFGANSIFVIHEDHQAISFRHRSFGEFLYAQQLTATQNRFDVAGAFEPYWIYVQFFHLGLMGDCPNQLGELMAKVPQDEMAAWLKILVMPDYFLAGHQTEYRLVEGNLYKLFIEAAQLYVRIKRGQTKTRLGELSEMHLLWFFQRLIRCCFDYEFFRPAITTTLLNIDQELLEPDVKYLALYFASCFAAELDDNSGFEYLVNHYGAHKLPMAISIAINLEKETNKDFSKLPIIKRHDRDLKALIKKRDEDKAAEELQKGRLIDDLFERPLKARISARPK